MVTPTVPKGRARDPGMGGRGLGFSKFCGKHMGARVHVAQNHYSPLWAASIQCEQ